MVEDNQKVVPVGVKIISIFGILLGIALVVLGIIALLRNTGFFAGLGLIAGAIAIPMGLFISFISYKLIKLKNWARITIVVLAGLYIYELISNLFNPINFGVPQAIRLIPITLIIIGAGVIVYLLFSKKVKEAFN